VKQTHPNPLHHTGIPHSAVGIAKTPRARGPEGRKSHVAMGAATNGSAARGPHPSQRPSPERAAQTNQPNGPDHRSCKPRQRPHTATPVSTRRKTAAQPPWSICPFANATHPPSPATAPCVKKSTHSHHEQSQRVGSLTHVSLITCKNVSIASAPDSLPLEEIQRVRSQ
jgi:hypothetical protein